MFDCYIHRFITPVTENILNYEYLKNLTLLNLTLFKKKQYKKIDKINFNKIFLRIKFLEYFVKKIR